MKDLKELKAVRKRVRKLNRIHFTPRYQTHLGYTHDGKFKVVGGYINEPQYVISQSSHK